MTKPDDPRRNGGQAMLADGDPTQSAELLSLLKDALDRAMQERGQMNVLIAGRTGVGKSTLINAIFQGQMAETGQGRPVTPDTREITKEGVPLAIWDTRGLELAAFDQTLAELEQVVRARSLEQDPNRHIHVAWLCVQEDGRRVEDAEVRLQEMLARHMPVLGVITKARADKGFRAEVQRLLPQARNVVRVRALAEELDDGHQLGPMGLEELVQLTSEVIPEGRQRAFAASQKASLDYKKKVAHRIVAGAAVSAAAIGAVPIPFADAILLVPIQVGMLAGISSTFGLTPSTAFLGTLVASAAGAGGAAYLGRAIVANLLKFIPGLGTGAGAAISGTTAAGLTTALGEAYIATLAKLFFSTGGETPSPEAIAEAFREKMQAGPEPR